MFLKQNPSIYKKYYIPQPSGVYPSNARLVYHLKINYERQHINRINDKKTHDHLLEAEKY